MIFPAISLFKAFFVLGTPPAIPQEADVLTLNTYTNAGYITGSGSLVKSGTGTLTLAGSNTYTGLTTVDTGVRGSSILIVNEISVSEQMTVDYNSLNLYDPANNGSIATSVLHNSAGTTRQFNLAAGSVEFTPIPEPSFFGAILAACSLLILRRARSRPTP